MRLDTASPLMSVASFPSCIIPPVSPELNSPRSCWIRMEHASMTNIMVKLEEISLPSDRLSHYTFSHDKRLVRKEWLSFLDV